MHEDDGTGSTEAGHLPARILGRGEGSSLSTGPVQLEYKVTKEDGAGLGMVEYHVRGRFEAPPVSHWHTREHAFFYVLEGELSFQLEQGEQRAPAGTLVHLPPGAPFAWSNPNDAGARFLAFWSPGGFERMFAEAADELEKLGGAGPEAMARVMPPLWEKYGIATAQDGEADA